MVGEMSWFYTIKECVPGAMIVGQGQEVVASWGVVLMRGPVKDVMVRFWGEGSFLNVQVWRYM